MLKPIDQQSEPERDEAIAEAMAQFFFGYWENIHSKGEPSDRGLNGRGRLTDKPTS